MKLYTVLFAVFSGILMAAAQDLPEWQNPQVFQINQVAPHTPLTPFTSLKKALENKREESEYFFSLNGEWYFKWVPQPKEAPSDFHKNNFDLAGWDQIKVPSNWQMEGYGHPKFRNIALTFPGNPPYVPDYYNPVGSYKRTFSLPESWNRRQVFLHFEGVKSASYVWINGKMVGYNQGGMEPAEYDVTNFLKKGENQIAVQVYRYSDGTYLENQDMWRLSGIYRNIYLFAAPIVHMRDYFVVTDLDENYKDAVLKVETELINYDSKDQEGYQLRLNLMDQNGKKVLPKPMIEPNINLNGNQSKLVQLEAAIADPLKWSAEKPDLYTLTFELLDQQNQVIEAYSHQVGFREVEVKDRAVLINGVPVKFNGVNSHIHHPETGKTMDRETIIKDFTLMKQFNINCVRTSHYPPDIEYLQLANEFGLYVFDEAGTECHSNIWLSGEPLWREAFIDRGVKMVKRDRNFPSVVIWSAGNEAGVGQSLADLIEEGKKIDPSRPAWMYGGNTFSIPFEDIVGPRYWTPLMLKKLAQVPAEQDPRPSYMDEYLSAAGNGLGGLDEYWDLIFQYPRLTGGAIWDWVSPSIKVPLRVLNDRSGDQHQAVIMGRAKLVDGKAGKGLLLEGHDQWVELYQDDDLDITDEITLDMWVKPQGFYQTNPFITKGNHQFGIVQEQSDSVEFFIFDQERITARAKVPSDWNNQWHHLVASYDGEVLKFYIDQQLVAHTAHQGRIHHADFPLNIGRNAELHDSEHPGLLATAIIDEVKIYDQAFTPEQLNTAGNALVLYLDFEQEQEQGTFYTTGLDGRTYGTIWADRTAQPEMWQIKKSAQPVKIEAVDLLEGKIKLSNRHAFTNLNELKSEWLIKTNGKVVNSGTFVADVDPWQQKEIMIPIDRSSLNDQHDHWLEVRFLLPEDQVWASQGHEIAWEQFLLTKKRPSDDLYIPTDIEEAMTYQENDQVIEVSGKDFSYQIDKTRGSLGSIVFKGKEIIKTGPRFNVWRAPLANDFDQWSGWHFKNSLRTPGYGFNRENHWRTYGLNNLELEVAEVQVVNASQDLVEVSVKTYESGPIHLEETPERYTSFENLYNYKFYRDGQIVLDHTIIPHDDMPDWLPKLGLQLTMPKEFNQMKWYGRGPYETYPDRKTGAKVDFYEGDVEDQYVPYLIPQDHGNKTDVRWACLTNQEGIGLLLSGSKLFNLAVHQFSTENLSRSRYPFQLKQVDYYTVNIDQEVSGVGDTSRSVLTQYQVKPSVYNYQIRLKPYQADGTNIPSF
ncbi:MAG: glycoside hydrolase family 2 TIM barrel-domain containing protein [Candidatus Cyclobacteriaceae bacterium M3_2C_046]